MSVMNFDDVKQKKFEIIDTFTKLVGNIDELNSLGIAVDGNVLLDLKTKLEDDSFKVLVIGEFKNGKSTFINALLGDKILPAYSTPCTAVINEVKYGQSKKAMLYFKNPLPKEMSEDIPESVMQHIKKYAGREVPPIEIDVEDLVEYVAIPDPSKDQADSISELPYSRVVLEYPLKLCYDGVEVIDSPGLNENGTRTKVTEEYLKKADAILFVFRCPKIAGQSEMEYIHTQIQTRGYEDIFFVCNAINQIPEEEQEQLIQFGYKKLTKETHLKKEGIFFLDALGGLKAKKNREFEALSRTGMLEFENALSDYLCNNKGKTKLLQVISPSVNFIEILREQHIGGYIQSLNQTVGELKKKIDDADPKLKSAEERRNVVEKRIAVAMKDLRKKLLACIDEQYERVISKVPEAVEKMKLDNHMTINPFTQKARKEKFEKEVIEKLERFVQGEMSEWVNQDLSKTIDEFIDNLQKELGTDIDAFYKDIDEFRYEVSGVETSKDISGFSRLSATIVGTIAGGPLYGALGASMGFGEIAKRSAISIGVSAGAAVIWAFTPFGVATFVTAASYALIGAGVLQLATGGKALTEKYKKQLESSFIESLQKTREESCNNYASSIVEDVKEKFDLAIQALDNEIAIEKSKVKALESDMQNWEERRREKLTVLSKIEEELKRAEEKLVRIGESIK